MVDLAITGLKPVPIQLPGRDLVPMFLVRYKARNTRLAYRRDLEAFFGRPSIGIDAVRAVTPEHVSVYLRVMEADGLGAATRQRRLAALRSFFGWCTAHPDVALKRSPADRHLIGNVGRPPAPPVVCLSAHEVRRLIEAARSARDVALVRCLVQLALRRSEASAINREDFQETRGHTVLVMKQTKGAEAEWVKVPPSCTRAVQALSRAEGIHVGPLFRSRSNASRGERLSPSGIYHVVGQLARKAGLESLAPHALRHTGCTLAFEGGATIEQVRLHARHKEVTTTLRYVHERDRLRDSAGDRVRF